MVDPLTGDIESRRNPDADSGISLNNHCVEKLKTTVILPFSAVLSMGGLKDPWIRLAGGSWRRRPPTDA
jgi:hypothetical protein